MIQSLHNIGYRTIDPLKDTIVTTQSPTIKKLKTKLEAQ